MLSIDLSIFLLVLIDEKNLISLSASKTEIFSLPETFGFSIAGFLVSRLPSTWNIFPPYVFFFSSIEDVDLIFFLLSVFNPKSTFDFSIDPLIDTFGVLIDHLIFFLYFD
jgi:hypothetical protein